jgi:4-carboxymuconolactone decarboxylase
VKFLAKVDIDTLIPHFSKLTDELVFGEVWERPELSKRDRSLITVAVTTALYRTTELKGHIKFAYGNGVTTEELCGLITHLAIYAGWPCAANARRVLAEVLEEAD